MMMKIIVLTSLLFIAVITAAVFYFSNLNDGGKNNRHILNNVPPDAAFLISFKNDKSFYAIFKDYTPIRAIAGDHVLHELSYLQNRILKQQVFAPYGTNEDLYMSFHPSDTSVNYLLYLTISKPVNTEEAHELLNACFSPTQIQLTTTADRPFFTLQLPELHKTLYVCFNNRTVVAGFSVNLLLQAVRNDKQGLPKDFIEQIQDANIKNNNPAIRLYLNNSQLVQFADRISKRKPENFLKLIEHLSGTSVMDINFKQDALMFSGVSQIDTGSANYLSLFQSQQPVAQYLNRLLPDNTVTYALFGLSDYQTFHQKLKNLYISQNELKQINEQLNLIKASTGINVDNDLLGQWGKEFAQAVLTNGEKLGFIGFKDSVNFMDAASRISTAYGEDMYRFNHSNLLYYAFGEPMRYFRRPYFMLINNYLVCANSPGTLRKFAEDYGKSRLLFQTAAYTNFDKLQTNQANVTMYLNNETYMQTGSDFLKPDFDSIYTDSVHYGYTDMQAIAVQLSANRKNFVVNLYSLYKGKEAQPDDPLWAAELNGNLIAQPAVVSASDTSAIILAQDESHILHAIDPIGAQLWNAQLPGPFLGRVYQFDDRSIVLTTAEKLYRFTPDGNPLPGFPITLPHQATSGVTLYNTDHRDARIYLAAGNRILAYNGDGKVLPGWENKTLNAEVIFDLKTTLLTGINYVIAATGKGRFYLFNYNGSLVSMIDDKQKQVFENPFGLQISPGNPVRSAMITTDTTGTIRSFSFDKKQGGKNMGVWSSTHFFDMCNLTGDSLQELVFIDKKQLYVYNASDSSLVYNYTFSNDISNRPVFFTQNNRSVMGIASEKDQELYVFEEDGSIVDGLPIKGLPYFYYGNLKNDGNQYLICGRDDNKLYLFRL